MKPDASLAKFDERNVGEFLKAGGDAGLTGFFTDASPA